RTLRRSPPARPPPSRSATPRASSRLSQTTASGTPTFGESEFSRNRDACVTLTHVGYDLDTLLARRVKVRVDGVADRGTSDDNHRRRAVACEGLPAIPLVEHVGVVVLVFRDQSDHDTTEHQPRTHSADDVRVMALVDATIDGHVFLRRCRWCDLDRD